MNHSDLALCFASEPQTIDPTLNTTVDGAVMIQHAFEGLMKWGDAAPDESTFQVTLTYDCPYFLEICAFAATFPVRKDIIEAYGDTWTTEDHAAYYISNGPYKLEEWVHDSYITLVPNQFYYDVDNLDPDSITFQLMADQNSMLAGYRAESLHFI